MRGIILGRVLDCNVEVNSLPIKNMTGTTEILSLQKPFQLRLKFDLGFLFGHTQLGPDDTSLQLASGLSDDCTHPLTLPSEGGEGPKLQQYQADLLFLTTHE